MSVEGVMSRIVSAVGEAMGIAGNECDDEIVAAISIQAERAGSRWIGSEPGEPPRRRIGELVASQRHRVISDAIHDVVTLIVENVAEYAPFLEFGTSRGLEPRPFYAPAYERWVQIIPELVAQSIRDTNL